MNAADADGALPPGWAHACIRDTVEFTRRPRGLDLSGEIPFLPMAGISTTGEEIDEYERRAGQRSGAYFEEGDFLLARITPCFENGKQGIARRVPGGWAMGTTEIYPMRSAAVSAEYLAYMFRRSEVRHGLASRMEGATGRMRVPKEALEEIAIPIAPAVEQRRIAVRLAEIDRRRAIVTSRLRASRAIVDRLRGAILAAGCSGHLTADWRSSHPVEHAQDLLDRALEQRRRVLGGRYRDEQPTVPPEGPDIPDSWVWASPGTLSEPDRPITYGVIKLGPPVEGGVPTLRSSDVKWLRIEAGDVKRISREIADRYTRTYLRGGEVLVTVRGTLGGVAVAPAEMADWNVSREVAVIAPSEGLDPRYCTLCIASPHGRRWLGGVAKGVAYTGVNIGDLRQLPLPLPPIGEQREIVQRVSAALAAADRLSSRIDAAEVTLDQILRSALGRAFRGQLVPTEAALAAEEGRDYESADELLARVHAAAQAGAE